MLAVSQTAQMASLAILTTLGLANEFAKCNPSGMTKPSPNYKALLESGVVSKPYASQIASGKRAPGIKTAIAIYRATGLKYGDLKDATAKQIAAMGQVMAPEERAA